MERRRLKPVALLSSDLDGTLAGDASATREFRERWLSLAPDDRPVLVYNSGRLVDDILAFARQVGLPEPDYAIGGVGTLLVDPLDASRFGHFAERFSAGWSLVQIEKVLGSLAGIGRQPARFQNAFKSSWYLHRAGPDVLARIRLALEAAGLAVTVVYSSGRDLDILPRATDKGQALAWLCDALGIGLDQVVVAGDTDNDRSMFELPAVRGIVVANALPELRDLGRNNPLIYNSGQRFARGVVDGLFHWPVFRRVPS